MAQNVAAATTATGWQQNAVSYVLSWSAAQQSSCRPARNLPTRFVTKFTNLIFRYFAWHLELPDQVVVGVAAVSFKDAFCMHANSTLPAGDVLLKQLPYCHLAHVARCMLCKVPAASSSLNPGSRN